MKKEKDKYPKEVLEAARLLIDYLKPGMCLPADLILEAQAMKKIPAKSLMNIWNNNASRDHLRPCLQLTSARRRICNARLKDIPDLKKWEAFIKMINKNEWCLGIKPSPGYLSWKANFDWFIRPGNIIRFLEGGFEQNIEAKPADSRENYGSDLERRNNNGGEK